MKDEETVKKVIKTNKYSAKTYTKVLKYLGKIKEPSQAEAWLKQFFVMLIENFLEIFVFRAFFLFLCLVLLEKSIHFLPPPMLLSLLFLAEGISLSWFLIIQFKNDVFRKEA